MTRRVVLGLKAPRHVPYRRTFVGGRGLTGLGVEEPKERLPKVSLAREFDSAPPPLLNRLGHRGGTRWRRHVLTAAQAAQQRWPHTSLKFLRLALEAPMHSAAVKAMGVSATAVLLIGQIEASLYLADGFSASVDGVRFMATYSYENFCPSCIWATKPANQVALALDLDPTEVLRRFEDTPADAKRVLQIQGLETTRSLIAGWTLLTQLLRVATMSMTAASQHRDRVLEGREVPQDDVHERVVRLCGRYSDVTNVSLARHGRHIFPVFEEPSRVRYLAKMHSENGVKALYWRIRADQYGYRHVYDRLDFTENWLVKTSAGQTLFILEADCTDTEDALALGGRSCDFVFDEASVAFRMLAQRMRTCLGPDVPFRPLRVVLGDSAQRQAFGGGHSCTLRERILVQGEADIIVDSRAPVLKKVLEWCQRMHLKKSRRAEAGEGDMVLSHLALSVDTNDETIFTNLTETMAVFGYRLGTIDDFAQNLECPGEDAPSSTCGRQPRIIYHRTTAETINRIYTLMRTKRFVDLDRCCVVVDKAEGIEELRQVVEQSGHRIEVICTASIHDKLLRTVRGWARMGYSKTAIQTELDYQFCSVQSAVLMNTAPGGSSEPGPRDAGRLF